MEEGCSREPLFMLSSCLLTTSDHQSENIILVYYRVFRSIPSLDIHSNGDRTIILGTVGIVVKQYLYLFRNDE